MNVNVVEAGGTISGSGVSAVAAPPAADAYGKEKNTEEAMPGNPQIRKMVAEMQEQIDSMNVSLKFSTYGEKGERIAVVVTNKETGEVIREIPLKEIQNLYTKMSEVAGVIFDRQI